MNIKHIITLSALLTCAFASTANTDGNVTADTHQQTQINDGLEIVFDITKNGQVNTCYPNVI